MNIESNPEYFLTIVSEGSFSGAAKKLYVSQPYLSRYIIRLEKELGTKLFNRNRTPIRLTEAGRLYKAYLESSEYLHRKLRSNLNEMSSVSSQAVRIGLGNWRGTALLSAILPEYLRRHPNVNVNLHEIPVSELLALTANDTVDFSVMNTSTGGLPESLYQEVIVHERILLVVNQTTQEGRQFVQHIKNGGEADLHLLQNQRFISLDKSLIVGNHIDNFLSRNQLAFPRVLYTTSNWTALELVAKGLGFCFMVETGLSRLQPELAVIDLHSHDLMIPLAFIRKQNSYLSSAAEDMMATIRTYYQELVSDNRQRTTENGVISGPF